MNWKSRFEQIFRRHTFRFGLATLNAERELLAAGKEFGARYVVLERRHVRERKSDLIYRYQYYQYLTGKPVGKTPFEKPLCLKQVFPNSRCSPDVIKDSTYLVYELVIPESYQSQQKQLYGMLEWYAELEERIRNESSTEENR